MFSSDNAIQIIYFTWFNQMNASRLLLSKLANGFQMSS